MVKPVRSLLPPLSNQVQHNLPNKELSAISVNYPGRFNGLLRYGKGYARVSSKVSPQNQSESIGSSGSDEESSERMTMCSTSFAVTAFPSVARFSISRIHSAISSGLPLSTQ